MSIPWSYYLEYWFKNSMLALATGILISFLIPQLYAAVPLFGLYFCIIYQVVMYRHLMGKRRGHFEYFARESLIRKRTAFLVQRYLGRDQEIRLKLDRFNKTVPYGWQVHQNLIKIIDSQNPELSYYTHMLGAELAQKEDNGEKERRCLSKALEFLANDLVGNFRLAAAFERDGHPKNSIEHYKAATKDPLIASRELKEYIENQIVRVMESGPSENPPIPGLRFLTW